MSDLKNIKEVRGRLSATYAEAVMLLSKTTHVTEEAAMILAIIYYRDPEDVLRDLKQGSV